MNRSEKIVESIGLSICDGSGHGYFEQTGTACNICRIAADQAVRAVLRALEDDLVNVSVQEAETVSARHKLEREMESIRVAAGQVVQIAMKTGHSDVMRVAGKLAEALNQQKKNTRG